MSIYAYLNCHKCKQSIWLGKALHKEYIPFAFHIGGPEEPKHWDRPQLNKVMWKFLADHCHHKIDVLLEGDMTEEMNNYQEVGGDTDNDISFGSYLNHEPEFYTK